MKKEETMNITNNTDLFPKLLAAAAMVLISANSAAAAEADVKTTVVKIMSCAEKMISERRDGMQSIEHAMKWVWRGAKYLDSSYVLGRVATNCERERKSLKKEPAITDYDLRSVVLTNKNGYSPAELALLDRIVSPAKSASCSWASLSAQMGLALGVGLEVGGVKCTLSNGKTFIGPRTGMMFGAANGAMVIGQHGTYESGPELTRVEDVGYISAGFGHAYSMTFDDNFEIVAGQKTREFGVGLGQLIGGYVGASVPFIPSGWDSKQIYEAFSDIQAELAQSNLH